MKMHAVTMITLLLTAIISVTAASAGTIMVEEGNTTFNVTSYDDGRTKPYRIEFTEENVFSRFLLDEEGLVRVVVVGFEVYKVIYDSEGDLVKVKNISSGRRYLAGKEESNFELIIQGATLGRRRLYHCLDCHDTWDVVCNKGHESVCDVNFLDIDRLSEAAVGAIDKLCDSFGDLCDILDGATACTGQCECVPSLQISLEWFDAGDLDLVVIEPGGALVTQGSPSGDYGFLDNDNTEGPGSDPENYLLASGLSGIGMLGVYETYVHAFSISNNVSWELIASENGDVVWTEDGTFAPGGGYYSETFTVTLGEYEDNECTNSAFHVVEIVIGKGG